MSTVSTDRRLKDLWADCPPGSWSLYDRKPLEIRLTKTPNGSPGIEFIFKTEPDVTPSSSNGFTCEVLAREDTHVVRIVRTNPVLPGLFEAFALDLIELCRSLQGGAANASDAVDCTPVIERIAAWQEFMRLRPEGLSKQAEIGLFGELSVLLDWLRAGGNPQKLADVWTGPLHGARDFCFDDTYALEVKSSVKITPFCATIESLEQLDTSEYPELRVAAVCLEEVDEETTLADRTESTKDVALEAELPETLATLCEAIRAHLPTELLRRRFESLTELLWIEKHRPARRLAFLPYQQRLQRGFLGDRGLLESQGVALASPVAAARQRGRNHQFAVMHPRLRNLEFFRCDDKPAPAPR